jgi:hypothetical protein
LPLRPSPLEWSRGGDGRGRDLRPELVTLHVKGEQSASDTIPSVVWNCTTVEMTLLGVNVHVSKTTWGSWDASFFASSEGIECDKDRLSSFRPPSVALGWVVVLLVGGLLRKGRRVVDLGSARDDAAGSATWGLQAEQQRGLLGNNIGRGCGLFGAAAAVDDTMARRWSESEYCCCSVGLERGVDFFGPKEPCCCAGWLDLKVRLLVAAMDPFGLMEEDERPMASGR